jgi:hypothetical protein
METTTLTSNEVDQSVLDVDHVCHASLTEMALNALAREGGAF